MPNVFWAILPERNGAANYEVFNSALDVAMSAGANGYTRIVTGYTRVDDARNSLVQKFMNVSDDPQDLLVMLDADHTYPRDIIQAFADDAAELGVVGALAYRRGAPYEPLFFFREQDGLHAPAGDFERGPIYECATVSTSCISIRRWVLALLLEQGYKLPFFRYEYMDDGSTPSEDMYFGKICANAGISHHCDTGIEIPHATIAYVDSQVYAIYAAQHPQASKLMQVTASVKL